MSSSAATWRKEKRYDNSPSRHSRRCYIYIEYNKSFFFWSWARKEWAVRRRALHTVHTDAYLRTSFGVHRAVLRKTQASTPAHCHHAIADPMGSSVVTVHLLFLTPPHARAQPVQSCVGMGYPQPASPVAAAERYLGAGCDVLRWSCKCARVTHHRF